MEDSRIRPGLNKELKVRSVTFLVAIFIIIILLLKIGYIQIIKNPMFSKQSEHYREKVVRIEPIRGNIYSSDGVVLAKNIITYNLYINPFELPKNLEKRQISLLYLSNVLNVPYEDIEKFLSENSKKREDLLFKENIPYDNFIRIKENDENMKGISIKENLIRNYPNKNMLSHVLGYIGPINSNELSILSKEGYQQLDFIGKNGIEKSYESELKGKAGRIVYEIDAKMNIQKEIKEKYEKAESGHDIELSIDFELQKNVEQILADRTGVIIVSRPYTGEILAMVSYPNYDPNVYILQSPENDRVKLDLELDTIGSPLLNRSIQSIYPPGSTFKIVTNTATLSEGLVSTEKTFYCNGFYKIGTDTFKCWVFPHGHGWQNLNHALINSCDVYYYNIARNNIDRVSTYAKYFGYGSYLGVDLPSEVNGLIPDPEWKRKIGLFWVGGDNLNTIIGQGDVKVTPLQILNSYNVISNRGYAYKPHLLKSVRSSIDGSLLKEYKGEKIIDFAKLGVEESVFNGVTRSLRSVITEGTGYGAFRANQYKFAGKTGTAELGMGKKKQTHSWFAGFGPIDFPDEEKISFLVLCEFENGSYYRYAAPLANMVASSYYRKEDYLTTAKRFGYPIKESYRTE